MELYWKAAAGALLAVILMLSLGRREMGTALGIAVCVMAALAAVSYLRPVMELLEELRELGEFEGEWMTILLKAAGIGMVTEIAGLICADSGSASLGKTLQLLGTAVILWMSIPLFRGLLELLQDILGAL